MFMNINKYPWIAKQIFFLQHNFITIQTLYSIGAGVESLNVNFLSETLVVPIIYLTLRLIIGPKLIHVIFSL